MAKGRTIWHRVAEDDLTEAFLCIGGDSPTAAERLLDSVEEATRFLVDHPNAGRLRQFRSPLARGVRSWPTPGFPNHLIFYRVSGNDIEIIRVLHGARDLPRQFDDE